MKNRRRIVSILVIVSLISGCAPRIKISGSPLKDIVYKPAILSLNKCTVVVTEFRVIENNQVLASDQAVIEHFMKQLRRSEVFGQVVTGKKGSDPSACSLEIKILLNERLSRNLFLNSMKAFFVGCSLYLLNPVLPMNYTFTSDMAMDVIRGDGKKQTFQAGARGKASIPLLYPEGNALNSLITEARERNYAAILSKMYLDEEFLRDVSK
jgi:hypothetical protein